MPSSPQSPRLRRRLVDGLGPVAAIAIMVLGSTLSVLIWKNLQHRRELEIERQTEWYASSLRDALESQVDDIYASFRRRAETWGTRLYANDAALWSDSVDAFLAENPSVLAVLQADPSWQLGGSAEGRHILRDALPEARRAEADADGDFVAGPLGTGGTRPVYGMQVRVSAAGQDPHTVFAVFDPRRLVADAIGKRALGYAVTVGSDELEIYRRVPANESADAVARKRESITLPLGKATWRLDVWPTSVAASPSWDRGPGLALLTGLALSALFAVALHFGTLAWRRERVLRRTNEDLEEQIDASLRGREELEQLSEALEARVSARTAELHETIVELETFNYSVSHDLRGPLGAVINFAAILKEDHGDHLDADGLEHLDRIVASASAAVSMMDALLAYSRSGRTELRKAHLDARALVDDVVRDLALGDPDVGNAVTIGDLPDTYADENMLRFVFANLIGNACKFVRLGEKPVVEVKGSVAGDEAIYSVRDEGVGFDMRFTDKLFKVFERLHASDRYAGHGVGLAIVARMVRRHGGRVWAQGAPDKGATFYFSIPAREGAGDGRSS